MAGGRNVAIDELLAHSEWLTRLAQKLAGSTAEDVLQETWVAALRAPPAVGPPVRSWLASVLRNAVRLDWRADSRRGRRDYDFHNLGPDHVEGVDEVYERVALQRFLTERVMALEESLRVVVVLRYVEGLDSSQIAERLGVPAGTVRWRLKRALDQLRIALDSHCNGERNAWVIALAPFGAPRASAALSAGTQGGFLMAVS
ncbi:MAG TPA: sigma-70 family RNA polymerase sigma factor, partial [Polyangia bacterium]